MTTTTSTFNDVLDAIEHLPEQQQAELIDLVRRRLAARGRERIAADARAAVAEFESGGTQAASVDEIMRGIES